MRHQIRVLAGGMATAREGADEALRLGIVRRDMTLHVPAALEDPSAGRVGACLRVLRQRSIPDKRTIRRVRIWTRGGTKLTKAGAGDGIVADIVCYEG